MLLVGGQGLVFTFQFLPDVCLLENKAESQHLVIDGAVMPARILPGRLVGQQVGAGDVL